MQWLLVSDGHANFCLQELLQVRPLVHQPNQFLKLAEDAYRLLEKLLARLQRGRRVSRRGDKHASGLSTRKDPHEVLSNVARTKRCIPPPHLYEVDLAIEFDDTIDLLDDALGGIAFERER